MYLLFLAHPLLKYMTDSQRIRDLKAARSELIGNTAEIR